MGEASTGSGRRLLERAYELASLHEHLREAADGRGRFVVIEGPAGIGKSELLRVSLSAAAGRGLRPLPARGSEFERDVPFGVARQILEPLLLRATPAELPALLTGPAAQVQLVLSGGELADPGSTLTDAEHQVFHAVYWLLVNASDRVPLAITVDDAQWADRASLRLLAYLERRIEGVPVLILATVRSGDPDAETEDLSALVVGQRTRVLRPQALSRDACAVVVREGLRQEPAPEFVDACHRATSGNPYFLYELVSTLRQARIEPTAAAVDQVLECDSPAVARMVMHRLARLPETCTRVAQAAAVLGPHAERGRVGALTGLEPADVEAALARLAAAELLVNGDAERLEFVHPLVRTAIRAEIAPAHRMRLSAAAARELAAAGRVEEAAVHLLDVPPREDEWTLETLLDAARLATGRGAPEVAATLLRRALREPPPTRRRVELLRRLGAVEAQLGAAEAPATLDRAQREAADPHERAEVARDLATACVSYGRPADAARVLDEAAAELSDADADLRRALDLQRVELAGTLPTLQLPDSVLERVAALAERDEVADCVLSSYLGFEAMASGRPAAEALEHVERALRGDTLASYGTGSWNARFRAAMMLGFCGEPARARQVFDDAVLLASRRGAPIELSTALGLRGAMSYLLGDIRAADADARESLELLPDDAPIAPTYLPLRVDCLLERDRVDEAVGVLEAMGVMGELPAGLTSSAVLAARGRVRIARGDLKGGRDDLLAAGGQQDAAGFPNPALGPWMASAALASHALGERDRGIELSTENLARAERFGVPFVHGRALRVHGVVLGGQEGLAFLHEAVGLLSPSYASLELAYARAALGEALHSAGAVRSARRELHSAIELAEWRGADALAKRARDALVAAGGRPRRRTTLGAASLTPAERRVVEAVAGGMSNRAAAQALFLSEKTVEGHLASAYRKLGVSSRVQLPQALAAATDRPDAPALTAAGERG